MKVKGSMKGSMKAAMKALVKAKGKNTGMKVKGKAGMKAAMKAVMKNKKKNAGTKVKGKAGMKETNPKVLRGKGTKLQVFQGKKKKTAGGLGIKDLKKNKWGKVVSKKKSENMMENKWRKAVFKAREILKINGFQKIGPSEKKEAFDMNNLSLGQKLLIKARELLKKFKTKEPLCLTPEEAKGIMSLISKQGERKICLKLEQRDYTAKGYEFSEQVFHTLHPGECLHTKVLDAYLDLLAFIPVGHVDKALHTLVRGVGYWAKIKQDYKEKRTSYNKKRMENFFTRDLVLLPILHEQHFTLVHVNMQRREYGYYCSLDSQFRNRYHRILNKHLKTMSQVHDKPWAGEFRLKGENKNMREKYQQKNLKDCGPFVAFIARRLVLDQEEDMRTKFTLDDVDEVNEWRLIMAYELYFGQLLTRTAPDKRAANLLVLREESSVPNETPISVSSGTSGPSFVDQAKLMETVKRRRTSVGSQKSCKSAASKKSTNSKKAHISLDRVLQTDRRRRASVGSQKSCKSATSKKSHISID